MSGNNDNYNDPKNAATMEILLFGAQIDDPALKGGLDAITQGITSSHIAARITFRNKALYEKYIEGTAIPCKIYTETLPDGSKNTVYEVYASYGPANSNVLNPGATLDPSYFVNTLYSNLLTPAAKNTLAKEMGIARQREVSSHIPVANLFPQEINLTPLSIIRYTTETKDAVLAFQQSILASDKAYRDNPSQENFDIHFKNMESQFMLLRDQIRPGMDMNEFYKEFNDNIGTIGLPERASYTVQLGNDPAKGHSLELALAEVRNTYDSLDEDSYNLIYHNCAHFIKRVLVNSTSNPEIKAKFDNDPLLGVSVPVSVINAAMAPTKSERLVEASKKIAPELKRKYNLPDVKPELKLRKIEGKENQPPKRPRGTSFGFSLHNLAEENALNNLAEHAVATQKFAVRTENKENKENNKLTYIFMDKNTEIARGFYDEKTKRTTFELPLPLDRKESDKLIDEVFNNIPNAKININAPQGQMEEAKQLQSLVKKYFADAEIIISKDPKFDSNLPKPNPNPSTYP